MTLIENSSDDERELVQSTYILVDARYNRIGKRNQTQYILTLLGAFLFSRESLHQEGVADRQIDGQIERERERRRRGGITAVLQNATTFPEGRQRKAAQ